MTIMNTTCYIIVQYLAKLPIAHSCSSKKK
jgi:hypothetical protein